MNNRTMFIEWDDATLQAALADWSWLIGDGPQCVHAIGANGAVFIQSDDDSIWLLDTWYGCFDFVAEDPEEFASVAKRRANKEPWFLFTTIKAAEAEKGELPLGKCFSWILPPMLSGTLDSDNIDIADLNTHVSMGGQIGRQIQGIPPGTKITDFQIEDGRLTVEFG